MAEGLQRHCVHHTTVGCLACSFNWPPALCLQDIVRAKAELARKGIKY